jgi:predicted nucleic acid-binding protein
MIVVSDTSPINYLILTGYIEILPALFGAVLIPTEVFRELTRPNAPTLVREWTEQKPVWLEVRTVNQLIDILILDPGERDTIGLALELNADLLLVDDSDARIEAEALGLQITGTLGVLARAVDKGLISPAEARYRLSQTSYRIKEELLDRALGPTTDRPL